MRLVFITILNLFAIVTTAQLKSDVARQHLVGKVKSVTELEYASDGQELKSETVSNYNDSGTLVGFRAYSKDHKLVSNSVFAYSAGQITEERRRRGDGNLIVKVTYKYDYKGNCTEQSNYDAGGIMFMKAIYKYDSKGNRTVCDSYNEFGSLFHKSNYRLDEKGNDLEEREYDSHHGLQFTTTWRYDEVDAAGNWVKRTTFKNNKVYSITHRSIILY